jgi:hypothetical protein
MILFTWFVSLFVKDKICQWSDINSVGVGPITSRICKYGREKAYLFQHNDGRYFPSFMDNTPEHPNFSFEDLDEAKEFVEDYLTQSK